jgi:FdhD protein
VYIVSAQKFEEGCFSAVEDALTVEEMLSICINGKPYTMTMRTPGYEEELTRGILLSEDVYKEATNPLFSIMEKNEQGYITKVNVDIPESQLGKGIAEARNLLSVSSCGMCGKYEADLELTGAKLQTYEQLSPSFILSMFDTMRAAQSNFEATGGSHASAAFASDGNMLVCREDIGRHNAVDKVIGHLFLNQTLAEAVCLLVSGRVSYEIVSKCFRAGITHLAAVSAPSSMAVDYCKEKGIHLFAFCRQQKLTKYS